MKMFNLANTGGSKGAGGSASEVSPKKLAQILDISLRGF
jgi:hypothetical protein